MSELSMDEITTKIAAIIQRANQDETYRQELLKTPIQCLQALGINLPPDTSIEVNYYPAYGVFLAIDMRFYQQPVLKANPDHFAECLHY